MLLSVLSVASPATAAPGDTTLYYFEYSGNRSNASTSYYLNTIDVASDGSATFGTPELISGMIRDNVSYLQSVTQLEDGSLLGTYGRNGWARIFTISAADIANGGGVTATMGGAINTTIEGAFTGCDGAIYLGDSGADNVGAGGGIIRLDPATLYEPMLGFTTVVTTTATDIDGLGPGIVGNEIVDSPGYALDSGNLWTWDYVTGTTSSLGQPGVFYELHALGGDRFDDGQARLLGLQAHPVGVLTLELREIDASGPSSTLIQSGPRTTATGLTGPMDCTDSSIPGGGGPTPIHQWSFTGDATDSVGTADAVLSNGATVSPECLQLDGINDFANLPIGSTISGLNDSTFEAWVTWDTYQGPWSRIFDFGSNTSRNMFLTPRNGWIADGPAVNTPRFAITTSGVGGERRATSASTFPVGVDTHVVVTIDADADIGKLYVAGVEVAVNTSTTRAPSDLGVTNNNYLGKSQYFFDPFFEGSINEFRIYDTALTAAEVAASFENPPVACPADNVDPVVAADNDAISTNEGADAANSGTYSDPDGDTVTLSANTGNLTDNVDGTWDWDNPAPDGPDSYTVTVTADDGNGGTASTSFSVTVNNVNPDVAADSAAISTNEGTDAANSGTYGDVAADTVTLSADIGTLIDNGGGTWSWSNPAPDGPDSYTVTITANDQDGGTNTATFTVTVNNVNPVATVDNASSSVQYSDPITVTTFTATDVAADSLTMVMSWSDGGAFAAGLPDLLTASTISCTVAAGVNTCERTLSGIADLAPGTYTVRMTATDDDGASSSADTVITVNQEDARSFYIGPLFVSTPSANNGSADVELRATIQDITAATGDAATDPDAGDIRNATVEFHDENGAVLCSAPSVDLVIAGDESVGIASCTWTANIGNLDADQFQVNIVVNGHYIDTTDNEVVVTVAKPLDNFITGGGYLVATDSAGLYAAGDGERVNYGFNVKFNKKQTNLQGRVTIIVRGADGHKYMIKANRLSSLGVILGPDGEEPHYAEFEGKANVKDLTDDLDLGGNRTLQMQMWDNGEPGENDTIGFSLWDGSGTLLFSSNWNGVQTVQQTVTGGNLQVH